MKIKFLIQEPGNFLHILDAISAWDIHTRGNIKRYYEKKFGISKEDTKFIKKFIKLRKKYAWTVMDSDFYLSKDFKQVKRKLKKRMNKQEFKEMLEIIDYFYEKTHAIFMDFKPLLIRRKKELEKEIKKHKLQKMFDEIAKFYGIKKYTNVAFVHLIVNTSEGQGGGGANIEKDRNKHITLEPRYLNKDDKKYVLDGISVMAHEILHLIEHQGARKKLKRILKKEKTTRENGGIIREAIADSLVPNGYLALKYKLIKKTRVQEFKKFSLKPDKKRSKFEQKRNYINKFRAKLSAQIYSLTVKQIKSGKSIFEGDYMEKGIETFKRLKKEVK